MKKTENEMVSHAFHALCNRGMYALHGEKPQAQGGGDRPEAQRFVEERRPFTAPPPGPNTTTSTAATAGVDTKKKRFGRGLLNLGWPSPVHTL